MNKTIIGCDPDSKGNGIAIYYDGKLSSLDSFSAFEFFMRMSIEITDYSLIELHIENVAGTKTAFTAKNAKSLPAKLKIAQNIGQCKQAQLEIERVADHFGIKVVRHNLSSKWKSAKEKLEFEKLTGWKGKSNEDTRSAAYLGYIGVLKSKETQCHT